MNQISEIQTKTKPRQHSVFLSLGSNTGNREHFIQDAVTRLIENPQVTLVRQSRLFENPAILYENQPDFLNQILEIETTFSPFALLDYLQKLEKEIGRKKRFRYGPREIDLDILTYDALQMNTDRLTIPHPGIYDREYLKILLAEMGRTDLYSVK